MNAELRDRFVAQKWQDQEAARQEHLGRQSERFLVPLALARSRKPPFDWSKVNVLRPSFLGFRTLDCFPLLELMLYTDWTPFFRAWKLGGRYGQILEDPWVGPRAKELFGDAWTLLM